MRTIIAGSRHIVTPHYLFIAILKCGWRPSVVISGTARGVDQLGEAWARQASVPIEYFPADWGAHGKRAGYMRNQLMADHAEALIAVWDGHSNGTRHMIDLAEKKRLRVHVEIVTNQKV